MTTSASGSIVAGDASDASGALSSETIGSAPNARSSHGDALLPSLDTSTTGILSPAGTRPYAMSSIASPSCGDISKISPVR